jgi:hypothetical protein
VAYNGDGMNGVAGWGGKDLSHQIIDRYVPDRVRRPRRSAGSALLAFAWFPVLAVVRRLRGRQAHPRWMQAARVVAWLAGGLATAFTTGFVTMTADGNAFSEAIILGSASLTGHAGAGTGGFVRPGMVVGRVDA